MAIALSLLFTTFPFPPNRRFPLSSFPQFVPVLRNLAVCCYASKKQGGRKKAAMSDEELCRDLREFMLDKGLPDDCVPSMKELSDNGRKDLANIVRRRGYKAVKSLLQNLPKSSGDENSTNVDSNNNAVNDRAANILSRSISSSNSLVDEKPLAYPNGAKFSNNHAPVSENVESFMQPSQFELARFTPSGQLDMKEGEDLNCEADTSSKACQDNEREIDRLKNLLNEKEIELSQLKRQIEDEKIALYDLQVKTEAEIGKIQRAIAEKDSELQAAEESLNGLKEVHIDYVADGQVVEVAGSFNGWQHTIRMDLHPSIVHQNPLGKQLLWSTVLWLYPGVYEIKFIVDGQWRVDSEREITTSGFVTNNVLRVDR